MKDQEAALKHVSSAHFQGVFADAVALPCSVMAMATVVNNCDAL